MSTIKLRVERNEGEAGAPTSELAQLPPIDEGFQNVLLDVLIVVVNRCELVTQLGKIFDDLLHPIIVDVVGGRRSG